MSPPGMRYGYEIELARDEWLMWMDMSAARSEMSAIAAHDGDQKAGVAGTKQQWQYFRMQGEAVSPMFMSQG
ncbi:hypothetical protein MAP00_008993 [Monascus purpureus]|nr:hypothetical protein MAP00_008993 [Monascus purpureus]